MVQKFNIYAIYSGWNCSCLFRPVRSQTGVATGDVTLKDNTRSTEEAFGAELDRREVAIFEVSGTLFFSWQVLPQPELHMTPVPGVLL